MNDTRPTNAQIEGWFRFLRDRETRFRPRFNIMVGYAYGYAAAALDAGREDLAAKKVDWLATSARKHGALAEEPDPALESSDRAQTNHETPETTR